MPHRGAGRLRSHVPTTVVAASWSSSRCRSRGDSGKWIQALLPVGPPRVHQVRFSNRIGRSGVALSARPRDEYRSRARCEPVDRSPSQAGRRRFESGRPLWMSLSSMDMRKSAARLGGRFCVAQRSPARSPSSTHVGVSRRHPSLRASLARGETVQRYLPTASPSFLHPAAYHPPLRIRVQVTSRGFCVTRPATLPALAASSWIGLSGP